MSLVGGAIVKVVPVTCFRNPRRLHFAMCDSISKSVDSVSRTGIKRLRPAGRWGGFGEQINE